MLEEKQSKHLGIPYVYLPEQKKFLCANGVIFSLDEYKKGIDLKAEYERREKEDRLYDYAYAKSTGLLRKKRTRFNETVHKESSETTAEKDNSQEEQEESHDVVSAWRETSNLPDTRTEKQTDRREEQGTERLYRRKELRIQNDNGRRTVGFIIALLAFTSVISGYISTLQTATYLYDYVNTISAWLMSASVTAYNVTAFEVAVMFKQNKRYSLTFIFIILWITVTVFSMATAVSVFYDRFNFNEYQVAEENRVVDSGKLTLEILQSKEKALRDSIDFKKQDIEYRQEHDYATTAVRLELESLQKELQENLTEQQELLSSAPEVKVDNGKRKERLFAFLGRILHVDSGVFEFTMSTLSAIFVNLIAPLSLVAVAELRKKKAVDKLN